MFGIGFGEFVLVMIVALLVIGPDKLPGLARSVAKAYNELRRTGNELKRTVTDFDIPDPVKVAKGIKTATSSVTDGIKAAASHMDEPAGKGKKSRKGKGEAEVKGGGQTGVADATGGKKDRGGSEAD